jgi:mRNA-degrading endonuclease RelE of RelBE toxin-antitoxin system
VCSIVTNATADTQLKSLQSSGDNKIIEDRLKQFAGDSGIGQPGFLDLPAHHLKGISDKDLKSMRRIRIGRHRVFYTGHYNQCSFTVFFIKLFKKTGVNDEADRAFQRQLASIIATPRTRTLRKPDSPTIIQPPKPIKTLAPRKKK